jgi:hypothetical protein
MKKTLILLLSFMIVIISASELFAKCAMVKYVVKGTVKNKNTPKPLDLMPLEGAQVFIYFDEAGSTYSEGYDTKYPDFFYTDKNGNYEASVFFLPRETFSILAGEKCLNNDPTLLEVLIFRKGASSYRRIFHEKDFNVSGEDKDKSIQLPEIIIWRE